jgi:Zn-dependent protease with chaperone function
MIVNEKRLGLSSEPLLKILIAAVWFSAAGYMLWTARGFQSEYEADAIAVRLIGRPAVVEGIYTLAQHEGGLTAKRRARLKALGEQIHETA